MLRELLSWVVFFKHFSGLLRNVEGILVGSRQTLYLCGDHPVCKLEGKLFSSIWCPRTRQDSARLRNLWGLGKKEAMFLLSWSSCWFRVATKQNVRFSARFGSYLFLYLLWCSGTWPRNLLMWARLIFVHLNRHICLPVCSGVSASAEVATSETQSKVQRWLRRSESHSLLA